MGRLNLSRRPGQSLRIGAQGEIQVTVVRVRGQAVDLVITADASVPVDREEIFRARQTEPHPLEPPEPQASTAVPVRLRRRRLPPQTE